jgi:hypothetical protein
LMIFFNIFILHIFIISLTKKIYWFCHVLFKSIIRFINLSFSSSISHSDLDEILFSFFFQIVAEWYLNHYICLNQDSKLRQWFQVQLILLLNFAKIKFAHLQLFSKTSSLYFIWFIFIGIFFSESTPCFPTLLQKYKLPFIKQSAQ